MTRALAKAAKERDFATLRASRFFFLVFSICMGCSQSASDEPFSGFKGTADAQAGRSNGGKGTGQATGGALGTGGSGSTPGSGANTGKGSSTGSGASTNTGEIDDKDVPSPPTDSDPQAAYNLIPKPRTASAGVGHLGLSEHTRIVAESAAQGVANQLASVLRRSTGLGLPVVAARARHGDIVLSLDPQLSALGNEGYRLRVGDDRVELNATTAAGLYYATVTLRQLFPPDVESLSIKAQTRFRLPRVVIEDAPRFAWRGYLFDIARHFFGIDELKRQIELAAYHKLNRFHLHLTDDQGWRIEIKSWPKLAQHGGSTQVGGGAGGYLTQEQFKNLAAFAAERYVTLVPEIDMPGHSQAALAAYGELNADGIAKPLYTGIKVGISSLWFDGDITYKFVDDVLREVAAITPGPYLHIGGDEAPDTDSDKYRNFMKRVSATAKKYGKDPIGWCEAGDAELGSGAIVQNWRQDCGGSATGAANGAKVIVSTAQHAYLDMKYNEDARIGLNWAGYVDVRQAFDFNPSVDGVGDGSIVGIEAALWTETVSDREDIDYLAFPRLCGHAELGWSDASTRDFEEYAVRLAHHGRRLNAFNVAFYPSPDIAWDM